MGIPMYKIANFFGFLSIVCMVLTLLRYILRNLFNYFKKNNKNNGFIEGLKKIYPITIKYHKIFGFLALLFAAIHFGMKLSKGYILPSGYISLIILLIQVILGVLISNKKLNKNRNISKIHRYLALCMCATVLIIHVLLKL